MSDSNPEADTYRQCLAECGRRIRWQTVATGLAATSLCLTGLVSVFLFLDFVAPLPSVLRLLGLCLCIGGAGLIAWRSVVSPWKRGVPDQEVAAAIDLACPHLQEAMASLVALEQPGVTSAEAGSVLMRARMKRQVSRQLNHVNAAQVIRGSTALKRCGAAGVAVLLTLVPLMIWQSGTLLLLQRFLLPLGSYDTATDLYFVTPLPGAVAARGDDVLFQAHPQWRSGEEQEPPSAVFVRLQSADGFEDRLPMRYDEATGGFCATLREVSGPLTWQIESGRTLTADRYLQVADRPQVIHAEWQLTPPQYSRRDARSVPAIGNVDVFEGSQVTLQLKFNKPVSQARLARIPLQHNKTDSGTAATRIEQQLPVSENDTTSVQVEWIPERSEEIQIDLEDDLQLRNNDHAARTLTVHPDQVPRLQVIGVSDGDKLRPDDILPLHCEAEDDTGLASLDLLIWRDDPAEAEVICAPRFQSGDLSVVTDFRVDLAEHHYLNGETVQIQVRTTDEYPPEPHEVRSEVLTLTIDASARAAGANAMSEQSQQLIRQLEEVRQQMRRDTQSLRQLRRQSRDSWEQLQQDSARMLGEQQQQQGRRLEELAERAAKHPLMEQQARQLQQLGLTHRTTAGEPLQQAAQGDITSAPEQLNQAQRALVEARSRLTDLISQLQAAAQLEQELSELNRFALQAEQLARASDRLQKKRQVYQQMQPDAPQSEIDEQLRAEAQQIEQQRGQLYRDLTQMLAEQQQLQQAAQQALQERLQSASTTAAELREQQQQLAQGVSEEAGEAAMAARELVRKLQESSQQETQKTTESDPQAEPSENTPSALNQIAEQLKRGNLGAAEQALRQQAEDDSNQGKLAETLQQLSELNRDRYSQPGPGLDRTTGQLQRLTEATEQLESRMSPQSEGAAGQAMQQAAQTANAGQFAAAADHVRSAAQSIEQLQQSADQGGQKADARQLHQLHNRLLQHAGQLDALQRDSAVRRRAQQQTQRHLAQHSRELPGELAEISEQLTLPGLQLTQQQPAVQAAQRAARQAEQLAGSAADELQTGRPGNAAASGHQAAHELERIERLQQLLPEDSRAGSSSPVPQQVGRSVTEALQHLKHAAQEIARQSSAGSDSRQADASRTETGDSSAEAAGNPEADDSTGRTQDGSGNSQPGAAGNAGEPQTASTEDSSDGQPGTVDAEDGASAAGQQALSSAAQALSQAANGSLPDMLHDPSMASGSGAASGAGAAAPDEILAAARQMQLQRQQREWARINDSLTSDIVNADRESSQARYSGLIRTYFQELARRASESSRQPGP